MPTGFVGGRRADLEGAGRGPGEHWPAGGCLKAGIITAVADRGTAAVSAPGAGRRGFLQSNRPVRKIRANAIIRTSGAARDSPNKEEIT